MKRILSYICVATLAVLSFASCKSSGKPMLPNVSGKAGEIIVVMDKADWAAALGTEVRAALGEECPYLQPREVMFSLAQVTPQGFGDLFKVHRNILIFQMGEGKKDTLLIRTDLWASPQRVVQVTASDAAAAAKVVSESSAKLVAAFEQAERDRVIANTRLYEEGSIFPRVCEVLGGSPHFPTGYKLRKSTSDFVWVSDDKQYSTQGVLMYKYPVDGDQNPFTMEKILAHRNEVMKNNVPGMFDNTYMTTSSYFAPIHEYVNYKGRQFAQVRGYWEVENDFMGGPFVSHSFYSEDGKDIIVLDAFVYAPKYDKRQYLRQVEALLYSFEWITKKSE